jgi:hypothetical protein
VICESPAPKRVGLFYWNLIPTEFCFAPLSLSKWHRGVWVECEAFGCRAKRMMNGSLNADSHEGVDSASKDALRRLCRWAF